MEAGRETQGCFCQKPQAGHPNEKQVAEAAKAVCERGTESRVLQISERVRESFARGDGDGHPPVEIACLFQRSLSSFLRCLLYLLL